MAWISIYTSFLIPNIYSEGSEGYKNIIARALKKCKCVIAKKKRIVSLLLRLYLCRIAIQYKNLAAEKDKK